VSTHPYEAYLRDARLRQQTDEFKERYRLRSAVERKQAELVQHGVRETRYLGHPKRQLQRLWTAAVVNLKCLFRLCQMRNQDLHTLLASREPSPLRPATA
jgi:Transposase DDE domain